MNKGATHCLRTVVLTAALLVLGGLWRDAAACVMPPIEPPKIIIERHSDTEVWITICGFTTFGTTGNNICVCALDLGDNITITEVKSVTITADSTGQVIEPPLEEVFDFARDQRIADAVDKIAAGDWSGFFAEVNQTVPGRIPVKIMFELCIDDGTSNDDLLLAVNNARLLTDEGDETTLEPTGHHQHIEDMSEVDGENIELEDERISLGVPEHFTERGRPVVQPTPVQASEGAQLRYTLVHRARIEIDLFDLQGNHINGIVNESQAGGLHVQPLDGSRLAAGIYILRLRIDGADELSRAFTVVR